MTILSHEHFFKCENPAITRQLFKMSVERIIMETSSYCNRRCGYCPNSFVDRISTKNYMPDSMLDKIFSNLSEIDFSGELVLHFYNEPLADPNICDKVAKAAKACPRASIEFYTNGDFLTEEYLDRLKAAGLKVLRISTHLGNAVPWSDALIINRLTELAARIRRPAVVESFIPGQRISAKFKDSDIAIHVSHSDYYRLGSTRGGLMQEVGVSVENNDLPCLIPLTDFYVSWDGTVMPCCHLHPDAPAHRDYRAGNLNDFRDIFEAYAGDALVGWRRSLLGPGVRRPPCDKCFAAVGDPATVQGIRSFYAAAIESRPTPTQGG